MSFLPEQARTSHLLKMEQTTHYRPPAAAVFSTPPIVKTTEDFVLVQQRQQAGSLLQAIELYRHILQAAPSDSQVFEHLAIAYDAFRDLPETWATWTAAGPTASR
jgi:hypothetical protein